jgi:hypothetical protein
MRDGVVERIFDTTGADGPTELKTSLLIPPADPAATVTYFLKVCDYQGDDGDPVTPYRIRANLSEIPDELPPDPALGGDTVVYHGETAEMADEGATVVELEHNSTVQKTYTVNTGLLRFNGPEPTEGITRAQQDGLTTITFPWIGGYIDFLGDQDWFELDLGPLYEEGVEPDAAWYYEIKLELHVGFQGSPAEYVWKFYRDQNQNQILVDRPRDSNGFFASAGDPDTDVQSLDVTIPEEGADQEFWVGDRWEGKFYLSMSDFNFVAAPHPDDDWDYEGSPYFFRLTLIYHPGESNPE